MRLDLTQEQLISSLGAPRDAARLLNAAGCLPQMRNTSRPRSPLRAPPRAATSCQSKQDCVGKPTAWANVSPRFMLLAVTSRSTSAEIWCECTPHIMSFKRWRSPAHSAAASSTRARFTSWDARASVDSSCFWIASGANGAICRRRAAS